MSPCPPSSTLFPYTTLFRSDGSEVEADVVVLCTGYKVTFPFFDPEIVSAPGNDLPLRSEEHTSELQSPCNIVCRLLLEKKNKTCEKDIDNIVKLIRDSIELV